MYKHLLDSIVRKAGVGLEHYSPQAGLSSIDPAHSRSGVDARTKGRDTAHPHSYFYRQGTQPEDLVAQRAQSRYSVDAGPAEGLYDLAQDPHGHVRSAVDANQGALNMDDVHQRLKQAGYRGFFNSRHPSLAHVVALYEASPVLQEHPMGKAEGEPKMAPWSKLKEGDQKWVHENWPTAQPSQYYRGPKPYGPHLFHYGVDKLGNLDASRSRRLSSKLSKAEGDGDDLINRIKHGIGLVADRKYRTHMATAPAGGVHAAPEHARRFVGHLAAAGHHAVVGDVANTLHDETQYAPEDRIYTSPEKGTYPPADWKNLKEAHHGLSAEHLEAARRVAKEHPDVWQHLGRAEYNDKPMVAAAAAALHPHAYRHTFQPEHHSSLSEPGDHIRELQDWAWTNWPGAEKGQPWKHTMQPVAEPRKALPHEVAEAAGHLMEGSAAAMTGEGEDPSYHPGAGHQMDRLLGETPAPPRKARGHA